ncbi:MAG: M20/M25/M40 family metallo-hydrolase [Thermoleophilia bacterium]|nr:M20/M25/M40 family metallo-hydrolase [Thermoleophilia bacterium]
MRQESIGSADPLVSLFLELAHIPSPPGQERDVNDFLITRLRGLGLDVTEGEPIREGKTGAGNLFCRIPGNAPGIPILLSAHTDTVASEPDALPDPVLEDGVLRSRSRAVLGADDKSAVAAIVYCAERIVKDDIPHADVEIMLSVGEESGLLGAKSWSLDGVGSRYGFCFDSTGPVGNIIVRSPSQKTIKALFKGKAAHAGVAPEEGRSAVAAACNAIAGMKLGRLDEETTANIGLIRGGAAANVVPDRCRINGEVRSHDLDKLEEQVEAMIDSINMAAAGEEVDVELAVVEEFRAFDFSAGGPQLDMAEQAVRDIGLEPLRGSTGGGSDVNVLNLLGLPCINMSTGMEKVHTPEEYITVEALWQLHKLILALTAKALEA